MAPKFVNIAALEPSKAKFQITARVTRIWEVTSTNNGKPFSLDMILLDSEGNHIHATVPQRWIRSYQDDLHEGTIYQVSHFEVAKNNKGYKPINTNENIIKFTPFTSVINQPESTISIAKHKFEFHPLALIHERNNKTDYLIDVIGILAGVEDKKQVRTEKGETELRNIYIEDERQNEFQVTLWGTAADCVTKQDTTPAGMTKTIVITSARVLRYNDEYQLKSTYATKVYINPDIPEAHKLLEGISEPRTVQHLQDNTDEQKEDPMMANRKTILELNEMEIANPKQTYTCEGVITDIRTDVDWRYISCPTCRKGLDYDNYCSKCAEDVPYPTQRYRILATISDGKTEAAIVIFDKEAEKIIGKPIAHAIDMSEKENGRQKVYDLLQKCVGKSYIFKVMLGTTTYTDTRELKVVKTYLNKETPKGPEAALQTESNEIEPKTPDKNKRKTRPREGDEQNKNTSVTQNPKKKQQNSGGNTGNEPEEE